MAIKRSKLSKRLSKRLSKHKQHRKTKSMKGEKKKIKFKI